MKTVSKGSDLIDDSNPDWRDVQRLLDYTFKDEGLLLRALTHRSFSSDHNERLEFLGDAVLGLAVSTALVQRWTDMPEGDLSRVRANLVKQASLVEIAQRLQLAPYLRLGSGELRSGGRERPSILADTVEAVIGAIYQDGGFAVACRLVQDLYGDWLTVGKPEALGKDSKTALQEWLQGRKLPLPVYEVVATHGLAHAQTFEVSCTVSKLDQQSTGTGASRREAEQAAASAMLAQLQA